MSFKTTATIASFGGKLLKLTHPSKSTACDMSLNLYLPPQVSSSQMTDAGRKVPVLIYLSGLTCTGDNCAEKGFFQHAAARRGIAVVYPDTSPRGLAIAGEDDSYDFGAGAGFYLDATKAPWTKGYNMATYITQELPAALKQSFAELDMARVSITGHSMGGHGALTLFLRNPGLYKSVSAFAPIANPSKCPWGEKAFGGYLQDKSEWAAYDATELVKGWKGALQVLIDVGTGDNFYKQGQLLPENFVQAAKEAGADQNGSVQVRMQDGARQDGAATGVNHGTTPAIQGLVLHRIGLLEELFAGPILVASSTLEESRRVGYEHVPSIRHVSAHNKRDLLFAKLLDGDEKRIGLALQVHQHRRILADLESTGAEDTCSLVLCHVRRRSALIFGNLLRPWRTDRCGTGVCCGVVAYGHNVLIAFSVLSISLAGLIWIFSIIFDVGLVQDCAIIVAVPQSTSLLEEEEAMSWDLPQQVLGKRSRAASQDSDLSSKSRKTLQGESSGTKSREKKHACPYDGCDKRFVRPARLEEHIRSHTNDRPFVCGSDGCDKAFLRQSHLDHHVKQNHTDERKWVCDWEGCGKSFVSGTRLRAHVKTHETKFYCTEFPPCKEIFRKKNTLQKHIDKEHLHRKPFPCTEVDEKTGVSCTAAFDRALKLRQHEATHHGAKRYWCTLCQSHTKDGQGDVNMNTPGFGTYSELQSHIRDVHPPTCDECKMIFKSNHQMRQHIELHHYSFEERATLVCPRPNCGKAFTKVGNLNVHVRTVHDKAKPWVCGEADLGQSKGLEGWDGSNACSQSFGVKSSLEGHIRTQHFNEGVLLHGSAKKAKTARIHQGRLGQDVSTAARLTDGFGDEGVRQLACIVDGCEMRFTRDYDLEVHCQNMHGLSEEEIGEGLAEQRALSGGQFWVRGAGAWDDDDDEDEEDEDAVQVGIDYGNSRVEPFRFIAGGGLSSNEGPEPNAASVRWIKQEQGTKVSERRRGDVEPHGPSLRRHQQGWKPFQHRLRRLLPRPAAPWSPQCNSTCLLPALQYGVLTPCLYRDPAPPLGSLRRPP
ncbi:hypothetical protein FH972_023765 [Carpinus fangiana]|uniref:S-formylglutathione hydrolase n=1 Tax=Carpinus fangiana TaxID=176857 RepID=A0A5N6KYL5_9ROSI|nr:hypothetical protein FH972_023765 [Carpinus fangiana]KAB8349751.1 hypothetical protein FH972_023765 [Carpinus fangiana]